MDAIDQQILQCLLLNGRAPMRQIGAVVGVSEQTASRRYRALSNAGALRVFVHQLAPRADRDLWLLRLQCRPDMSSRLGRILATRHDVAWVATHSGGSEVMCTATSSGGVDDGASVLPKLSNSAAVLSFSAYSVMHSYSGGDTEWSDFDHPLDRAAKESLIGSARPAGQELVGAPIPDSDRILVDALRDDGRLGISRLAHDIGWPASRVKSRVRALLDSGAAKVDVDVLFEQFGFRTSATLLIQVAPNSIRTVGDTMARHRQTSWVAAITGSANIVAAVTCRDVQHLFRYVTDDIGTLPGILHVEILPISTRHKQAATRVVDGRLERHSGSNS